MVLVRLVLPKQAASLRSFSYTRERERDRPNSFSPSHIEILIWLLLSSI